MLNQSVEAIDIKFSVPEHRPSIQVHLGNMSVESNVNIHKHQLMLESLGIYPKNSLLHDLEAINEAINHPGEFLAYIHADACPDNVLDTGETLS